FCARGHPLFERASSLSEVKELSGVDYVSRGYVADGEAPWSNLGLRQSATAYQVEGIALLILSGRHIGYLPVHYADPWVNSGDLRQILPSVASYRVTIATATRSNTSLLPAARTFLNHLRLCAAKYNQRAIG